MEIEFSSIFVVAAPIALLVFGVYLLEDLAKGELQWPG